MRTTFYLLAIFCVVLFGACKQQDQEPQFNTYNGLADFLQQHCLTPQHFTINNQTGGTITGLEGLVITIPANMLVNANGQLVNGNVDVELIEALKFDEIVFSRRSNHITQRPVQTNGQFLLQFRQNGGLLKIDSSKFYTVKIPRKDPNTIVDRFCVQENVNYYEVMNDLEVSACSNQPDTSGWIERSNWGMTSAGNYYQRNLYPVQHVPDTVQVFPGNNNFYLMKVSQTGWIACNTYEWYYCYQNNINNGNGAYRLMNIGINATYPVKLTQEFSNSYYNTMLYIYAKNKFICPINLRNDPQQPYNFTHETNYYEPPFKLIAFGVDTLGITYYGELDVNSVPSQGPIPLNITMQIQQDSYILNRLHSLE